MAAGVAQLYVVVVVEPQVQFSSPAVTTRVYSTSMNVAYIPLPPLLLRAGVMSVSPGSYLSACI